MSAHTPGPWHDSLNGIIDDTGKVIAVVNTRNLGFTRHARLIAAAPKLLRALNLAYKLLCTHADTIANTGEHPDNINNAIDLACEALTEAAIAKAEGRE